MPFPTAQTRRDRWTRVRLGLPVLAVLVLVSACSRTQFLYERADWMAMQWLDGLVDADAGQHEAWSEDFAAVLEQHRGEQLPGLLAWLDDAASVAEAGLNEGAIACLRDDAGDLIEGHARLVVPVAVRVLRDLSPRQVDELARRMAERNRDYTEDYLAPDPQARESLRFERYAERIEYWTGRLTEAQRQLVERTVTGLPDTAGPWLDYRMQQQQRLLALLRAHAPADELDDFLRGWWVGLADRPDDLVVAARHNDLGVRALLLGLDASLSNRQRAKVVERLRGLHRDLSRAARPDRLAASSLPAPRCQVST